MQADCSFRGSSAALARRPGHEGGSMTRASLPVMSGATGTWTRDQTSTGKPGGHCGRQQDTELQMVGFEEDALLRLDGPPQTECSGD